MPDAPQTYAVRLTAQARQDIFHAAERLAELANDPPLARAWAEALYEAVARLATNPRAYTVLARETRLFGQDTQRMLFRRSAGAAAYYVLFAVADASADGPIVTILTCSARQPQTAKPRGSSQHPRQPVTPAPSA